MCETKKLGQLKEEELAEFDVLVKDLKPGQEGLLVAVRKCTSKLMKEVNETELKNIMTVRIEYPRMNLRVIVAHAPQETDKSETRVEFYEELSVQIERCITSGDELVVVGDMNARIVCDDSVILPGKDSPNGKLLSDLIQYHKLKVGNFDEKCTGKWTHIQACKDGSVSKSVLDYVLLSENMHSSLNNIIIDEDKLFCPYRVKMERRVQKCVFSDHCTIIADLQVNTGIFNKKKEKIKTWDFKNKDGFEHYQLESRMSLDFDLDAVDSTEMYASWVVSFEKLLSKCFRRRTYDSDKVRTVKDGNMKEVRNVLFGISKKGKVQRNVIKIYQQKLISIESCRSAKARAERLKETTMSLTFKDKFSPSGYWKVKTAAEKGTRKEQVMLSVVKDNGVEVHGEQAVVECYKEEFERRLANREPKPGWEEYTAETNRIVRSWLEGESMSSPPFTDEEMETALMTLKEDSSAGVDRYPPKLFKKAGSGVVMSLKQMCNKIKQSKDIPEQWELVRFVPIYKQKGSKKKLKYYRGIFLSIIISKVFEKLIKNRIEGSLKNVNILNAGSRKERGPVDNTFLFRGVMDHHKFTNKTLYVTAYDFEQAFDSLWLEDCILSLKDVGVEKEYLQLIYNLNKRAAVTVQTPYGPTSTFHTDPIVKQGTVLGPNLCSASTGEYCGENIGVCVGNVIISSLLYVDDIIDLSSSIDVYVAVHLKALLFLKRKKLNLSGTKCYTMILNRKTKNGEVPVLIIDEENNVILATEIKYLGDIFNSRGNNDGLIADRVKRGTRAMITIASLMSETEVGVYHVSVMLLLYQSLFLSTTLFNSQAWSNLRKKDIDELRGLQLKFLKRVVGVASSSSNSFTFLELGVLPIEYEIEKRQLIYLHKILQLSSSDPVSQMFWEMKKFHEAGEKNWWSGIAPCLAKYGLPQLDQIKELSKECYKRKVKESVGEFALKQLVTECCGLKKTADLKYDCLKLQDYFSCLCPSQARLVFKWRSQTLNIKTHLTYKYNDTLCRGCQNEVEDPYHIINCGAETKVDAALNVLEIDCLDDQKKYALKTMIHRIASFLEKVK